MSFVTFLGTVYQRLLSRHWVAISFCLLSKSSEHSDAIHVKVAHLLHISCHTWTELGDSGVPELLNAWLTSLWRQKHLVLSLETWRYIQICRFRCIFVPNLHRSTWNHADLVMCAAFLKKSPEHLCYKCRQHSFTISLLPETFRAMPLFFGRHE